MTSVQILSLIFTFLETIIPVIFITIGFKLALYPKKLDSGKGYLRCDITTQSEDAWKYAHHIASKRVTMYAAIMCVVCSAKFLLFEASLLLSIAYTAIAVILFFTVKPSVKNAVANKYGYPDDGEDKIDPALY